VRISFDHLVVAARTLDEGAAWVESRLGVPMAQGGKHAAMATHNRLLCLGPGRFLEVIAIDPDAPPPGRPRWFTLDEPETQARLAQGPKLLHWVVRTDDIERAIAATAGGQSEVLALSRGDYRWKIGVPASGSLAQGGVSPTVIQWQGKHPADALPDSACRLERLVLHHPEAQHMLQSLRLAGLSTQEPIGANLQGLGLEARIRTPRGIAELSE
jgi:Glyoxalase-like domain